MIHPKLEPPPAILTAHLVMLTPSRLDTLAGLLNREVIDADYTAAVIEVARFREKMVCVLRIFCMKSSILLFISSEES